MHPIKFAVPLCSKDTIMMMKALEECDEGDEEEPESVSLKRQGPRQLQRQVRV